MARRGEYTEEQILAALWHSEGRMNVAAPASRSVSAMRRFLLETELCGDRPQPRPGQRALGLETATDGGASLRFQSHGDPHTGVIIDTVEKVENKECVFLHLLCGMKRRCGATSQRLYHYQLETQ
jgi:hypothetical protein